MKVIEVLNLDEATEVARSIFIDITPENRKKVAFTGGRFGEQVLSKLSIDDLTSDYEIFQTDERFVNPNDDDCIQTLIINELFNLSTPNKHRVNFFSIDTDVKTSVNMMTKTLNSKRVDALDVVFLSLGEDGHMAVHFRNSVITDDNRICYTENAIKLPKKRISYNVSWLFKSKLIILCAIGPDKEKAYNELFNAEGLHSESITNQETLILLRDKNY